MNHDVRDERMVAVLVQAKRPARVETSDMLDINTVRHCRNSRGTRVTGPCLRVIFGFMEFRISRYSFDPFGTKIASVTVETQATSSRLFEFPLSSPVVATFPLQPEVRARVDRALVVKISAASCISHPASVGDGQCLYPTVV